MLTWFLWFAIALVSAIVCESVARSKGHSGAAWFFGALVCWPIALIGVLALGNRKMELLMRQQMALQSGQVDERLSQDLLDAGLREKTPAERDRDKRATFLLSAVFVVVVFVLLIFYGLGNMLDG